MQKKLDKKLVCEATIAQMTKKTFKQTTQANSTKIQSTPANA